MAYAGVLRRVRGLRVLTAVLLVTAATHAFAGSPVNNSTLSAEELQGKLDALRQEIEQFTRQLEASKSERSLIENELKRNETEIGDLIKRIEGIESDLRLRRRKLAELEHRQRELVAARKEQQQYIAEQVRAAYKIGRQEYVKVLLNQEDPSQISRMLKYYDYFNRARADQVDRYNATLKSIAVVAKEIEAETAALEQDQAELRQRRTALEENRAARQVTLAKLNSLISDRDAEIRKLATDRDHLEELLERITRNIVDLPTPASVVPFAKLKGEMELPVQGRIVQRFGSQNKGKVKWNGLFIEAQAGEPVHAIHYGRVVFSNWLRGFGLLVIIDHGDGYMSLYGHNEAIYRETGEWVQAGDVIALVGNSGGLDRTGLYFEIRVAGKPTDPQLWCLARSQ